MGMGTPYVELHCHSYFSLLDGASSPEALVARAHALGYPALALTDRDGLYGAVRFWQAAREKGIKVGLLRPQTLYPFPDDRISELTDYVDGVLVVEMNAGQMIDDVRLAVGGQIPVDFFGRMGGVVPMPDEIEDAITETYEKLALRKPA